MDMTENHKNIARFQHYRVSAVVRMRTQPYGPSEVAGEAMGNALAIRASASRIPSIAAALRQQPTLSTHLCEYHYRSDIARTYIALNHV
jgi:hypothetical protein